MVVEVLKILERQAKQSGSLSSRPEVSKLFSVHDVKSVLVIFMIPEEISNGSILSS